MPVSPLCLVADGIGSFLPTTNGLNIGAGDTASIQLASVTGVTQWYLQIIGTDETVVSPPTLTGVGGGNLVSTPSTVVTFTFPPAGSALLFRSTVNGTGGPVATTFALFSLTTGGYRVGPMGLIHEGSTAYGWSSIVNPAIRNIGAGGGVSSVSGSSPIASSGGSTPTITYSIASQTQGDIAYFNGTNWVRLPAGTSGKVLVTEGSSANPQWGLASDLSIASETHGDILYFNGTNWVRLPAGTAGQVLLTEGSSANPQWGLASDLNIASEAQGDILYFNGTNWVRLAAGTSGQFLKTLGTSANPVWATPSGVTSVTGSPPIASSGGTTPAISISAATDSTAGSMSAADKTKLDTLIAAQNNGTPLSGGPWETINAEGSLTASDGGGGVLNLNASGGGGGVTSVTGSSPIASSGGTTPNITYSIASQTQGDIAYFNGTNWVRLPAGTAGQFLETQGSAANPQWASGGIAFSDNGVSQRTVNAAWNRTNGQASSGIGVIHTAISAIPALVDGTGQNTAGSTFYNLNAGAGLAVIGDNVYVTGNDSGGATAHNGMLYGFNKLTQTSLTGSSTPIHQYGGTTAATAACPNTLLGVRMNVSGTNTDYLFAACQKTVELGYLTGGGATYNSVYITTMSPELTATSVWQGAVEAVCLNQSLAGADTTTPPWFAFIGSHNGGNEHLWSVSPTGVITDALSPTASHGYQALCVDDDGFVWAVENGTTGILHKLSFNYTTGVFTSLATGVIPGSPVSLDVKSDGRSICVLSTNSGPEVQIVVVDRLSFAVIQTIVLPGAVGGQPVGMSYPTRLVFDGTSMWVALGNERSTDTRLWIYSVNTESGEVLMDLGPYTPGGTNQNNRSIAVMDDGTVLTATLNGGSSLALVYTSNNIPTVHGRNVSADSGLYVGGVAILSGNGVPNSSVVGNVGDLYLNTAGGSGTTLYVKESGVNTNTGWVGK